MANETATLAAYVADLKFADIPPEVLERAKVLTLDFLGSAIRARRDAESTASLLKMLEALALDGKGESTVFGDGKTWTPAVAALLSACPRLKVLATSREPRNHRGEHQLSGPPQEFAARPTASTVSGRAGTQIAGEWPRPASSRATASTWSALLPAKSQWLTRRTFTRAGVEPRRGRSPVRASP